MGQDDAVEAVATIADGDVRVEVELVRTRNGRRLRLEAAGASIALDAIALEALTWQDGAAPVARAESAVRDRLRIGNEYTAVDVVVPEGEAWLGLASRRLGYERRLEPATLAEIAGLDMSAISGYLSTPFGPQG